MLTGRDGPSGFGLQGGLNRGALGEPLTAGPTGGGVFTMGACKGSHLVELIGTCTYLTACGSSVIVRLKRKVTDYYS